VLEVNSKQGMEIKLQGKLKNFLFVLTQRNYYKSWKHFNFVTEELKNEFIEEGLCTEEDAEIFTNSINLSRIPLLPVSQNERPNLIFIGHPGLAWNGINQMMDLANCWNNATFHIVGEEKPNQVICGDNVLFHGYLKERDYQDIAKNCHLAIGTLGIQSKSMYFGCSLKTREYLALGLPVVIRYFDVDFAPSQSPFIFTLPVDNRPISSFQKEISQFLDKWRHERVSREAISAIGHIQRESKRVAYFRSLTSGLR
jgi:hypothetical protein